MSKTKNKNGLILCLLFSVSYVPVLQSLALGQLSILLFFSFAGLLWSINKRYYLLSSFFLFLLCAKPHLFFLFLIPLIHFSFSNPTKTRKIFLQFIGILLGASLIMWRASIFYIKAIFTITPSVQNPSDWRSSTLADAIRAYILPWYGYPPEWPRFAVPLFGLFIIGYFFYMNRHKDYTFWLMPILCVSFLFSPYGWFYDQSILLITHVWILVFTIESSIINLRTKIFLTATVFITNLLLLFMTRSLFTAFHEYFWYPVFVLAEWALVLAVCGANNELSISTKSIS